MCCPVAALLLLGPRAALIVWWLLDASRFSAAFSTWLFPVIGFLVLPMTTLAYLLVFPNGVDGFDWVWIGLGVLVDVSGWGGGAAGRRR